MNIVLKMVKKWTEQSFALEFRSLASDMTSLMVCQRLTTLGFSVRRAVQIPNICKSTDLAYFGTSDMLGFDIT